MGKYNELKEHPSKDILGVRHKDSYSSFLHRAGKVTIIHGFPLCPECKCQLGRLFNQDTWICSHCHTVWSSKDLVNAIETENALTTISIRSLSD